MSGDYSGALEGIGLSWELPYSDDFQENALNNQSARPNMINQQQPIMRQQPMQQYTQQPVERPVYQQLQQQPQKTENIYEIAEPSYLSGDICEMFPYLPHCIAGRMM